MCLCPSYYFNPLPLYRGRPIPIGIFTFFPYFNPLPLYRGRRISSKTASIRYSISIHSLFTEGDDYCHKPLCCISTFQSTPSLQRETLRHRKYCMGYEYFNPLPLYRGRLYVLAIDLLCFNISIHSLFTEGDSGLF